MNPGNARLLLRATRLRVPKTTKCSGQSSYRVISTVAVAQLKVFPEFVAAQTHEIGGNYAQALPLYQRMHEILSGALGKTSIVSIELTCHNAKLLAMQGEYSRAIKLLTAEMGNATSKTSLVRFHTLLAEIHLLSGDKEMAYNAALQAKDAVEAHSESGQESEDELALFSPTYGLLGTSTSLCTSLTFCCPSLCYLTARCSPPSLSLQGCAACTTETSTAPRPTCSWRRAGRSRSTRSTR